MRYAREAVRERVHPPMVLSQLLIDEEVHNVLRGGRREEEGGGRV